MVRSLSSSPASDASATPWLDPDCIADHMENVVNGYIEAINTRTYEDHPSSQFFAPDVVVALGRSPAGKQGLKTHYDDVRSHAERQPGHVIETVSNCSSSVDLKTGYACLLCNMEASDPKDGLRRQQATVFVWRLEGMQWRCVRYTGIRGIM